MSLCPNCGEEINQGVSYCIHCQTNIKQKKITKINFPLVIAIITFLFPIIFLLVYQFFTLRREDITFFHGILVLVLVGSLILTIIPILKKPTNFGILSLIFNLIVLIMFIRFLNSDIGDWNPELFT